MASYSSPSFRKQLDSLFVGSQPRRLRSENYIHRINSESVRKNLLSPTPDIPREVRNLLLWGSGDTQNSLAGDYNLPLHREDISSSQSSDSIRYEFVPRCSVSDSIFYTMRRNYTSDNGPLLFPSMTSVSLTSENGDDDDTFEEQSSKNIPIYSFENFSHSLDETITPNSNDNDNSLYPRSVSRQTNSRLNTTEIPDYETAIENRNDPVPLVTAGSIRLPPKIANLKKNLPLQRATDNMAENMPLLKDAISLPKNFPICEKKTSESLKKRILEFCETICPCCACPLKK